MPPKKQKQKPNQKPKASSSKSKSQSSDAPKPSTKLQISAENERRLRRLLLNSGMPPIASTPPTSENPISKAQKAKKLRSIYEKLSCEGFTSDQIEQALSALNVILCPVWIEEFDFRVFFSSCDSNYLQMVVTYW